MRFSLNVKLLTTVVVAVAVFACSVHLLHGYQVRRSAKLFLARADEVASEGKKGEEANLLKSYLTYRPDDIDVLERYGLVLSQSGEAEHRTRALTTLEKVLSKSGNRATARRKAAELAESLGQLDTAKAHYEFLVALKPNGDAEVEEALGRCELELKRYPEARSWLERSIAHAKERINPYVLLSQLLRGPLKDPEQADRIMDARRTDTGLIASNPQSARAYLERAGYRGMYAIPGAAEDYKQALALGPDDPDVLLNAALVANYADASRLLNHGLAMHSNDPRFWESLAWIEFGAGKRDLAIDLLRKGVSRFPQNDNLRWNLAEFEIDANQTAQAEEQIKTLRKTRVAAASIDFLEARLFASTGRWTEAARLLAKTAPTLETLGNATPLAHRAFLLLAQCHYHLGNPDMRYAAARRAVARDVGNPSLNLSARVELASSLMGLGKYEEAANEYRVALKLDNAPAGLRLELGRALIARNLQLPSNQRDWTEVEDILSTFKQSDPPSADLLVLQAETLAARDRLEAAEQTLKQAESSHPNDPGPQVALATLAERQNRPGQALSILNEARSRLGDRPVLMSALIRYWSMRDSGSGSQHLKEFVNPLRALSDHTERRILLKQLAEGLDRVGESAESATIRNQLIAEQPDDLGLRIAQLDSAWKSGKLTDADRALSEIQRIEGAEGVLWRYGRAQLLIEESRRSGDLKSLGQASVLLAEVRERRPGWSKALLASAELADLRGDSGSALRDYLSALGAGERNLASLRRTIQLLYSRGRFAEASALLERVQQEEPLSPELNRIAADVAMRTNRGEKAIEMARQAVAQSPESGADLLWLGQVLFATARSAENQGRPDESQSRRIEAEKALSHAIEVDPSNPDARVALVMALAAWNRTDDALVAIQKAESTLKGTTGELALARCLSAVGQTDRADAKYQSILQSSPDNAAVLQGAAISALQAGNLRKAEPLLRHLIALQEKTPQEAAWARRVLALALATDGHGGSAKARALLGLDDATLPGSTATASDQSKNFVAEDLRTKARVLAGQPGRASRRRAIASIDALTSRDAARPDDLFLRVQLIAAEGDWKRALASATQLHVEDSSNPAILEFLARGQIAAGAPEEATTWINKLAQVRSQAPVIVDLQARVLFATHRAPEALKLLDNLVEKVPAQGRASAALMEEMGQLEAAEALLRRLSNHPGLPAQDRVEVQLALAGFLGRRERHSEAIAICETLWADPRVAPSRVSSVALVALYTGHPQESVLQRVDAGIATHLQANPSNLVLRFDQANLAILRGRYSEAETTFKEIRKADPELSAPLNNLAWLLALLGQSANQPLDLIDQAIALDGPLPELLDTRGLVLIRQGQPDQAIRDLEESITAAPTPMGYFHLATAFQKAGRLADAEPAFARARSAGLKPTDVHPLEKPAYLDLVARLANP